ncbi:hypothetical protein IVA98_00370 [Bradyrhizobium sp. 160]|uniref:hypothetical protein n=1 Tax=unclassified Bradyrhizobium TaxID=2631580 RepID=UPI001FFA8246|nr:MULTISPECIES: hypothetical protein [unclassified Bradyrhizobium]MCK1419683.1 hypothetical protein [Bradyrhizobium sp. CW12]MCK1491952.1 hypothetical protein [Bradyrhizobium sp. 180]MCK1621741.1 hypothetical protein [Bradyrhizobium sp. 160]MCK1648952.1 hypothetical protein [Bradyrhizobium sp. 154]
MKTQRDAALLGPQVNSESRDTTSQPRTRIVAKNPTSFQAVSGIATTLLPRKVNRGCKAGEKQYHPGNFFSVGAIGLRIEESPNTSRCWSQQQLIRRGVPGIWV